QARTHLIAMAEVRSIKRCRIVSRRLEHAQSFAEEMGQEVSFQLEPVEMVKESLKGARLSARATNAAEPIVKREWISAGAHLNLVGSSIPNTREVDSETMAGVRLFVDRPDSTLHE